MPAAKINSIRFSKACETFYETDKHFVPFIRGTVEQVAAALVQHGDDTVFVKANISSNPKLAEVDVLKFNRRLVKLCLAANYVCKPFVRTEGLAILTTIIERK